MHRTHTCGELRATHTGETVTLSGRVDDIRDMWGLTFVTLRDRYGVTQVQLTESADIKPEYCIKITGTVTARPDGQTNSDMPTGEIELIADAVEILNTCKELPFPIRDEHGSSEEIRFKHRFLDLRRSPVLSNIEFRAKMNHFTRNRFVDADFLEVQTPIFTVSSPEWARDYLIPSRVNPGKFYALPQAPQQYKQLLMVGWVDKYFQIAPCFRDEDPRADRHSCEFYQVDAEMSFVEQDDVFAIAEAYASQLVAELVPHKSITVNFAQIPYAEAMELYGCDKPDLRFGMLLMDVTKLLNGGAINFMADKPCIKCIKLDAAYTAEVSRKVVWSREDIAKQAGAGWLPRVKRWDELGGSIGKLIDTDTKNTLQEATDAADGDILLFAIWSHEEVSKVLNKLRLHLRDEYNLADNNELAFCWITDFPFYELNESSGERDFGHNPFSHIIWWVEALKTKDFSEIQTNQYDMVLNGYEILSWSIRNHDPAVMVAAFEKLGMSETDVKERFGAMYEAFQYGAPPHGWFAFGFDRMMMILLDEPNIRECYAFPKSGKAEDTMMWAPATLLDEGVLDELGICLTTRKNSNSDESERAALKYDLLMQSFFPELREKPDSYTSADFYRNIWSQKDVHQFNKMLWIAIWYITQIISDDLELKLELKNLNDKELLDKFIISLDN